MPMRRLGFRKGLNQKLTKRDIAKKNLKDARTELKREQRVQPNNVPASKSGRVRQESMHVNRLKENVAMRQGALTKANREVKSAQEFRKKPVVRELRFGQALANIFLGSNRVTSMTRKMKRVFKVSKPSSKGVAQKSPIQSSSKSNRLNYSKGVQSNKRGLRR